MKYVSVYSIGVCFSLFFVVTSADAARLDVQSPERTETHTTFSVDVLFDTEGKSINSVDMSVAVAGTGVRFLGYQEKESLVKLWIAAPTFSDGVVSFAGSIPGGASVLQSGYGGTTRIPLVRLLFSVETPQSLVFSIPRSTVLLHDGKGTAVPHTRSSAKTIVTKKALTRAEESLPSQDVFLARDTVPPQNLVVELYQASLLSRTPSLLYFNATDAESGIRSYTIARGRNTWTDAQSPFVVPRTLFPATFTITAFDSAGNIKTALVQVPGVLSLFSLLALCVLFLAGFWLHSVVKKKV